VQDLALVNELTEASGSLLDWGGPVDALLIIKVAAVRPEARSEPSTASRMFAGVLSRWRTFSRSARSMCCVSVSPRWLSWPNFVASTTSSPRPFSAPDELLVKEGAVDLGGVDQGHAEVDGPVDRPDRLLVILPRPRVVRRHPHRPKPMRATSNRPSHLLHRPMRQRIA
jgi:hypothetical protein